MGKFSATKAATFLLFFFLEMITNMHNTYDVFAVWKYQSCKYK